MPSAVRLHRQTQRACHTLPHASRLFISLLLLLVIFLLVPPGTAWPHDYRFLYNNCPGPEWNIMCRMCCEYDVIQCKCPIQGTPVGYAVPCCRNARHECDPCIIHPGCSIFENCKRCNNGTWAPKDDFFIRGQYCAECRPGWSGGDCMTCGGVIRKRQGHIVLESYPTNARCEWTLQVDRPFTIELRFMMISLEFDHNCRYDYVEVRDGDSLNSRVIGRFCGNERPPPIHSTGNSLHILFVSDGYKTFDGLFAIFQENSACTSSPCLHDGTCILDSSHSYHCACLAGYTGRRCEHVLECGRPPLPEYGSVESLDVRVGGQALFSCDPGFIIKGFPMSTCLLNGSWSTPTPVCVPEKNCAIPPKPANGDHLLLYGQNDVLIALQYLCSRPYTLIGTPQRTCLANNTWSGTAPVCVKEEDINPVPDSGKGLSEDIGKDQHAKKEEETTPNKTISLEIPLSGKERTGQDVDVGKKQDIIEDVLGNDGGREAGIDSGKAKPTLVSKDKMGNKDEDSMNKVRKNDSDNGKLVTKPTDKEDGLDSHEKDPNKDLDKNIVDLGLTEDKGTIKEIIPKKHKATEKESEETVTDLPQYTIISLREDENDNVPYKIDTSSLDNSSKSVDNNDIEGGLETLLTKESPKIPQKATEDSSTEKTFVTTRHPVTEGGMVTDKPAVAHEEKKSTQPTPETQTTKKPREDIGDVKENRETELDTGTENLSIIEAETRKCPPPPRLYHGYYEWVPGLDVETVEFSCNHSYALSGKARRTCQPNGTWSGTQPICVRACREPKVSVLVKQKVLSPQVPFRKTPVHKFYSSSGLTKLFSPVIPTKGAPALSPLPPGFHHLYTHIEYECTSPYYQHTGSTRRTCLKTGKWSGRHVSCSPVCGQLPNFNPQSPADSHWPWLAAIYRLSGLNGSGKMGKVANLAGGLGKGLGLLDGEDEMAADTWQLVCSGALLNQRSVAVAAHCVTELGKLYPLDVAKLRVVLGKQYRSDLQETKSLQRLRISSITVHPNYDPLVLDSDLAILKLLDKARIGEQVLPICLPERQDTVEDSSPRRAMVTGWSLNPNPSEGDSERARVGTVMLGDMVHCEQQYAHHGVPISLSDNMLCGRQGPGASPSNICPAETGGLLILPPTSSRDPSYQLTAKPSLEWKLLGLVSFGYDTLHCNPELYTVYTHISNFVDFLEGNMK